MQWRLSSFTYRDYTNKDRSIKQEVVLKFLDAQYCVTCDTNVNIKAIKQLFQVSGNINAELMNADELVW